MRAPAVSFTRFAAAFMAALLMFALLPNAAFAEGEGGADVSTEGIQDANSNQAEEAVKANTSEDAEPDTTVSAPPVSVLAGAPAAFVNTAVAFDGEPVIGSFTVDGLTFVVVDRSTIELVGASEAAADASSLLLPEAVAYNGVEYSVTSIGAYAFYLSGVTSVKLPASITEVDDRAFRSSDVALVEVAEGNTSYSSFDGALYDADQLSLLLIPEGKQGTVLLPSTAESAAPSVFSHCPLVTQITVEEGSAAFASENGLLYTADLTTLLRVPAGATEITIREGCTTIAAGAMEACASLATINAPASVTSISSDVFTSVPTVSLPAVSIADDRAEDEAGTSPRRVVAESQGLEAPLALPDLGSAPASLSTEASGSASTQLTALVALSTTDDDLPEADPANIAVVLPSAADKTLWGAAGFQVKEDMVVKSESFTAYSAGKVSTLYFPRECKLDWHSPLGSSVQVNGPASEMWAYTVVSGVDYCTVRYHASYGYYLVRDSVYPTVCVLQGAICSGISDTPDGPMLAVGARAAGSAVYFHSGTSDYDMPFDLGDGSFKEPGWSELTSLASLDAGVSSPIAIPTPMRPGYRFAGWQCAADDLVYESAGTWMVRPSMVPYARSPLATALWEPVTIDFDVDSEPGDDDYPGEEKPSISVPDAVDDGGRVEIEDPKRPGYVFQGWTIPNAEGTEAIDQELVYQDEADGKWYVDASKLPDYANDEGRVELTARWTSVISVDVPSAVTFYADVVTQGNESREGAVDSAFGQNKVASQSEVDLRIVGLESTAVETQGSTLGADSILKKAASATPSSSTQKLFSLYPTSKALTPDDLQDPDAVSATKPADAVDFALDDILLEKSFAVDKFTIPAGDTLNLGYRLNLFETGTELDYDKLATLEDGQSASIANVSYTFAGDAFLGPVPSGDEADPLYVTVSEEFINANDLDGKAAAGTYGLSDIKAAADDLSANGTSSAYWPLYKVLLDSQVMTSGNAGSGPYFQLKVDGATGNGHLPLQLIGICQDTKSDGSGKAGLTFQMRDIYAYGNTASKAAGGASFASYMNPEGTNTGGWKSSALRSLLRSTFRDKLPAETQDAIVGVDKYQQLRASETDSATGTTLQKTTNETIWLPSMYEVYGTSFSNYNNEESSSAVSGYIPFQYMAYVGNAGSTANAHAAKTYNGSASIWRLRSVYWNYTTYFCRVSSNGDRDHGNARDTQGVAPCFCL